MEKVVLNPKRLHVTVSCAAWNDARKGVYLKPLFKTCPNPKIHLQKTPHHDFAQNGRFQSFPCQRFKNQLGPAQMRKSSSKMLQSSSKTLPPHGHPGTRAHSQITGTQAHGHTGNRPAPGHPGTGTQPIHGRRAQELQRNNGEPR